MSKYTVKGIKSWNAREGLGTQCNIYCGTKKVAQYTDDGNGGEPRYDWVSKEAEEEAMKFAITLPESAKWCAKSAFDIHIARLCDDVDMMKQLKKMEREHNTKSAYFRGKNKTYAIGEWSSLTIPVTSPRGITYLDETYGKDGYTLFSIEVAKKEFV